MGIWMQLLKSAGFVDVRMEVRDFDAGATSADKDHRRPDIVCYYGGVRYIIDLTIAWASAAGAVEWRDVGWDADQCAKAKPEPASEPKPAPAPEPEAEGEISAESGDYAAQFQAKFFGVVSDARV